MILKAFSLNSDVTKKYNILLFYGKNEGYKKQEINKIIDKQTAFFFDEKEIIENKENFFNKLLSGSLFDEQKSFVIKRATDKFTKIIEEIENKNIKDIIIINSDQLEKKSKLRSLFEKNEKYACVPFYADNNQTLSRLASDFINKEKILISKENINLIIDKTNGDREMLYNELEKIKYFALRNKKITTENLSKLVNLAENRSILELIDNCLAKNKKKTINILNENNYSNDDCILIIRSFLSKAKKILKLANDFQKNKNIELTISTSKPPIFWKDKEITKKQVLNWKPENIKQFIYKLNNIELLVKKNLNNSINLTTNLILEEISEKANN